MRWPHQVPLPCRGGVFLQSNHPFRLRRTEGLHALRPGPDASASASGARADFVRFLRQFRDLESRRRERLEVIAEIMITAPLSQERHATNGTQTIPLRGAATSCPIRRRQSLHVSNPRLAETRLIPCRKPQAHRPSRVPSQGVSEAFLTIRWLPGRVRFS